VRDSDGGVRILGGRVAGHHDEMYPADRTDRAWHPGARAWRRRSYTPPRSGRAGLGKDRRGCTARRPASPARLGNPGGDRQPAAQRRHRKIRSSTARAAVREIPLFTWAIMASSQSLRGPPASRMQTHPRALLSACGLQLGVGLDGLTAFRWRGRPSPSAGGGHAVKDNQTDGSDNYQMLLWTRLWTTWVDTLANQCAPCGQRCALNCALK
jgi:hypothetical protein